MEYLAVIIFAYFLTSVFFVIHFFMKMIDEELFDEGFQVLHILFFPSLIVAFLIVLLFLIAGIIVYYMLEIFTFRLK